MKVCSVTDQQQGQECCLKLERIYCDITIKTDQNYDDKNSNDDEEGEYENNHL